MDAPCGKRWKFTMKWIIWQMQENPLAAALWAAAPPGRLLVEFLYLPNALLNMKCPSFFHMGRPCSEASHMGAPTARDGQGAQVWAKYLQMVA